MSSNRGRTNAPGRVQVLGMSLLSIGFYGEALGEGVLLVLLLWPYALQNDFFLAPFFLAVFLVFSASLLILASLFILKVHWLAAIGAFLLSLLAAFGQGWLFPNDATYGTIYWSFTYGGVMVLLSLILLSRVKGVWSALWRTLLVAGAGAAIAIAVLVARGPDDWKTASNGSDFMLLSLVIGVLIPIAVYWLVRIGREPGLKG